MRKRSGRPPRFASVPNETVDDSVQLDFMALALLTVLLRHRDGWEITLKRIGKRYGYGEDAMAGAMGLLQVARYVVKVRVQVRVPHEGARWRTEVAVYDTPATDDDVAELLEVILSDIPEARHVEVIEPTRTALAKAANRRAKLGAPRPGDYPDSGPTWEDSVKPQVVPDSGIARDSGDPGVSKKTISKKTKKTNEPVADAVGQSAGGFASAGAREGAAHQGDGGDGGSAASGTIPPQQQNTQQPRRSPRPATVATRERQMPPGADTVIAAIPPEVCRPGTTPWVGLRRAIADLLAGSPGAGIPGRTPSQVIERMNRCWYGGQGPERSAPGYIPATDALGDQPIRNRSSWLAAAILHQECPDPKCEDGRIITTGRDCADCAERRHELAVARQATAAAGARLAAEQAELQALEDEARASLWQEILDDAYTEYAERERRACEAQERANADARLRAVIAAQHPQLAAMSVQSPF